MQQGAVTNTTSIPIPPAGRDENDQPYWIVNGSRVYWQEMQKLLMASQPVAQATSTKSVEAMPQISNTSFESPVNSEVEKIPEVSAESAVEKSTEQVVVETGNTIASDETAQNSTSKSQQKTKKLSIIGDGPDLPTIASLPLSALPAKAEELMGEPESSTGPWLAHSIIKWISQLVA